MLVEGPLANQPLTTMVDAKEQVEHDSYQWQKDDHQHPCHRLGWLPIVHNDVDDSNGYHYPHQNTTYDIQFLHMTYMITSEPRCLAKALRNSCVCLYSSMSSFSFS